MRLRERYRRAPPPRHRHRLCANSSDNSGEILPAETDPRTVQTTTGLDGRASLLEHAIPVVPDALTTDIASTIAAGTPVRQRRPA